MQNIPDCPREKGFFPVSYQVSTQDIWINDICSVTDKPRIRMWPWSSIMHSYHMVNIPRAKTISLFNAKIREIRFYRDSFDTEKCTTLIFSKWYFSWWHFQVDIKILHSSKIRIDIHLDLEKYIHVFGAFSTRFRYSKWTSSIYCLYYWIWITFYYLRTSNSLTSSFILLRQIFVYLTSTNKREKGSIGFIMH